MATFADIPLPEVPVLAGAGPFSGVWAGYWGGVIPHVLLADGGGPCVYAVGAVPLWNIPASWSHWDATISDARLVLSGARITVEYWPEGLDTLAGRYRATAGGDTWGRFVRMTPDVTFPTLVLERLAGTDLRQVMCSLDERSLEGIAGRARFVWRTATFPFLTS